jgi:hypothetical protein
MLPAVIIVVRQNMIIYLVVVDVTSEVVSYYRYDYGLQFPEGLQ